MTYALVLSLILLPLVARLPGGRARCPAPVVRPFAPQGPYAGHWGVDLAAQAGTPVVAVAAGHGHLRRARSPAVSASPCTTAAGCAPPTPTSPPCSWPRGRSVAAGTVLGASGVDHGHRSAASFAAGGGGLRRPAALARVPPGAAGGGGAPRSGPAALCFRPCAAASWAAPSILRTSPTWWPARRLTASWASTWSPSSRPGRPWQKADLGVSPAGDRWEMTRRAVAGVGYFEADDREVTA